jgi:hypothetical protein
VKSTNNIILLLLAWSFYFVYLYIQKYKSTNEMAAMPMETKTQLVCTFVAWDKFPVVGEVEGPEVGPEEGPEVGDVVPEDASPYSK